MEGHTTGEVIDIATAQLHVVIERLAQDEEFRLRYCQDPDGTLGAYLTPEELRALKTGEEADLKDLIDGEQWSAFIAAICRQNPCD